MGAQMWNQKQKKKTVRDGVCPCLPGNPQGDSRLCIFLLPLPRGPRGPVPNHIRMYRAGKPETCWGPWAPHIGYVSPWFVFVSSLVLSFLFGKWRRPLSDFCVVVGS